jgi:BirA family transcriptional regulator, biotin operon repressor / biotin---[acetyl-CoA-carboxylase] ligase
LSSGIKGFEWIDVINRDSYTLYSARIIMKERKCKLSETELKNSFIGHHIYYYDSLESTMDTAKELARQGARHGTIVITEKQNSGRGRLKRTWLSPEGNIAMSIILNPSFKMIHHLIMISSVAVARAINTVCRLNSQIKWPNDVMINDKKVCGILIENEIKDSAIKFSIIGIGINISLTPADFPDISKTATSLSNETGSKISKWDIIPEVIREFEQIYLATETDKSIFQEWKGHISSLGKLITLKSGEVIENGIAEDVTEMGNLLLRKSDGTVMEVTVGDVTVIKE